MYAEQLLPHDVEAEEAVIGSLLIDSDSFLRISSSIRQGDFYREKNGLCFKSCVELFRRSPIKRAKLPAPNMRQTPIANCTPKETQEATRLGPISGMSPARFWNAMSMTAWVAFGKASERT